MLFGMLFHVLVTHQHDFADPHSDQFAHRLVLEAPHHDHDDAPDSEHSHLDSDHPNAYLCPSSAEAQDSLALKLASLLARLPLQIDLPQPPLKLAAVWDLQEPQPPPEQRQRVLTTTILLI